VIAKARRGRSLRRTGNRPLIAGPGHSIRTNNRLVHQSCLRGDRCLVDCLMRRFCEVKHGRMIQLAGDMTAAANAIREARERARWVKFERNFPAKEPDSEWRLRQPKSWPPKRSRSRASMTCARVGRTTKRKATITKPGAGRRRCAAGAPLPTLSCAAVLRARARQPIRPNRLSTAPKSTRTPREALGRTAADGSIEGQSGWKRAAFRSSGGRSLTTTLDRHNADAKWRPAALRALGSSR
jgi:hypothetical protein